MKVGFVFNILDRHWQMFGRKLHAPIQAVFAEQGVDCTLMPIINYPSTSLAERGERIAEMASKLGRRAHLVALSVSGVDARLAIGHLGLKVKSLTTISSPNHGSRLAEWAGSDIMQYHLLGGLLPCVQVSAGSFAEMAPDNLAALAIPTQPDVQYYSTGSSMPPRLLNNSLNFAEQVLNDPEEFDSEHDGVFMQKEQEWENYLTTFNLSHNEFLGQSKTDYWKNVYRLAADNIKHVDKRLELS